MKKKEALLADLKPPTAGEPGSRDRELSGAYPDYMHFPHLFCDEVSIDVTMAFTREADPIADDDQERSGRDDAEIPKGLCSNCAGRRGCRYPKPESGIWHCEEYL